MKTLEHASTSTAAVQRQSAATSFFDHTAEQESPFFAAKEGSNAGSFFNPPQPSMGAKPLDGSPSRPTIQAKLTVGAPNDKYEQEADLMADKVVQRMGQSETLQRQTAPSVSTATNTVSTVEEDKLQKKEEEKLPEALPELQRSPVSKVDEEEGLQMKCADCEKEEHGAIQRKENGESKASASIESRLSASKGGGSPLPNETRGQMESAMGADFSGVRMHTGSEAVQMSQDLNAHAFTHGSDVYFNSGKYNPSNTEGSHLLAHELTHTVQQGAAVQRKPQAVAINPAVHAANRAFGNTSDIQRSWLGDAISWVGNKIESGVKSALNSAAETLIPGYSLLNVILGKNLITGAAVARSGVNLVQGYMELVPVVGSLLLSELKETDTLTQAGVWTEQQVVAFGINFGDIAQRLTKMWDEISISNGIAGNIAVFKRYIGPVLGRFLAFSSVMQQKMKELRLEGALRLVGATELLGAIKASPAAFKRVVDKPQEILNYFMEALKRGFSSFKDNFGTHFKNALFGWLLGKAASMGIQMPKDFSMAGIFHLVAQLAGLTYDQLKALVIQKLGRYGSKAAKIFEMIEKGVDIAKRVAIEGPIALWEMLKDKLANLKDMVLSQITELVTSEIIKSAVTKLLSMLNPAGALVQLVMTIYRVVKFFIDNWATISEIASGIISSITKVALGQLGGAAAFIESILAKGVQLIISFLARIFGLSDIANKVKELIKKFSAFIIRGRDYVVNWLAAKGKEFYEKIFGKKEDKKDGKKGGLGAVENEIKAEGKEKGKDGEVTKEDADQIVANVKRDQADVIKNITVIENADNWEFDYVQRSKIQIPKKKVQIDSKEVRNRLYEKGANKGSFGDSWGAARDTAREKGMKELTKMLKRIFDKDDDKAEAELKDKHILKNRSEINTHNGYFSLTVLNFLKKKKPNKSVDERVQEYMDKETFEVDHIEPLAQHWTKSGYNTGDKARWNKTTDPENLWLISRSANRKLGAVGTDGGVYDYSKAPGESFKTEN